VLHLRLAPPSVKQTAALVLENEDAVSAEAMPVLTIADVFTSDTCPDVPVPAMASDWHFPVLPVASFQHTIAALVLKLATATLVGTAQSAKTAAVAPATSCGLSPDVYVRTLQPPVVAVV
jgi:hypothetical protein